MVSRFNGMKRAVAGLLCLVLLLGVLSACASGSKESATQEITVKMGDYFFDPRDITVKSGKVKFVLSNVGKVAHRFEITGNGFEEGTKNVLAGQEGVLEVTIPVGVYKTVCRLGGGDHEKQGSVGKLTVQ